MIHVAVFGNCQAEALTHFLKRILHNDPSEIHWIASYESRTEDEIAFIKKADLILEQIATPEFYTLAPELKGDKPTLRFPFIGGTFLWPFEQAHPKNVVLPHLPRGPFPNDVGNMFLNRIINEAASAEEALNRWFDTDIKKLINLDRVFNLSCTLMKKIGSNSDFSLWEEVESSFRYQRLFWTSQHATRKLIEMIIRGVVYHLKISFSPEEINTALVEGRSDTQCLHHPLHPQVIEHFDLKWCNALTKYRYYDEDFYTYEEFIKRYVDYQYDDDLARGSWLTRQKKDLNEAENLIRQGIKRHPQSAYALDELSLNLEIQGRIKEALETVKQAIDLQPKIPRFHQHLANLQKACGQNAQAMQTFEKLQTLIVEPI